MSALQNEASAGRRLAVPLFAVVVIGVQVAFAALARAGIAPQRWFDWGFLLLPVFAVAFAFLLDGRDGVRELVVPLVRFRVHVGYWLFALLSFPILLWVSAAAVQLATGSAPLTYDLTQIVSPDLRTARLVFSASAADEIAWFGFVFCRLHGRYTLTRASLIVGALWGLWYLPVLFVSEFAADTTIPPWMFFVNFLALGPICGWLYASTKSALLVVITNAVANYVYFVIPILPRHAGTTDVFVVKVVLMALLSVVLCVLYRRGETPAAST